MIADQGRSVDASEQGRLARGALRQAGYSQAGIYGPQQDRTGGPSLTRPKHRVRGRCPEQITDRTRPVKHEGSAQVPV